MIKFCLSVLFVSIPGLLWSNQNTRKYFSGQFTSDNMGEVLSLTTGGANAIFSNIFNVMMSPGAALFYVIIATSIIIMFVGNKDVAGLKRRAFVVVVSIIALSLTAVIITLFVPKVTR
jgi:hypothetical protein